MIFDITGASVVSDLVGQEDSVRAMLTNPRGAIPSLLNSGLLVTHHRQTLFLLEVHRGNCPLAELHPGLNTYLTYGEQVSFSGEADDANESEWQEPDAFLTVHHFAMGQAFERVRRELVASAGSAKLQIELDPNFGNPENPPFSSFRTTPRGLELWSWDSERCPFIPIKELQLLSAVGDNNPHWVRKSARAKIEISQIQVVLLSMIAALLWILLFVQ